MESKKPLVFLTISALIVAAFFAIRFYQASNAGPSKEELTRIAALEQQLAKQEQATAEQTRLAQQREEARKLAAQKAELAAQEDAKRQAELAKQVAAEQAEKARLAQTVATLNTQAASIQSEKTRLAADLNRARLERDQATAEASAQVEAATASLTLSEEEARNRAEREAARVAVLEQQLREARSLAAKTGKVSATVVDGDKRETITSFLQVEVSNRNHLNNTRTLVQKRIFEE